MDNQNNNSLQHRGVLNGRQGTWVPVESRTVPFEVSSDPQHPSAASDGNYYYAQGGMPQSDGYGPIQANRYNAIPTPSNIVQLPPIVQPIALVPYASQNQPMVQYDPNYREEIQQTNLEPIYKAKPYTGVAFICAVLSLVAIALICLMECLKVGATPLDTVMAMFKTENAYFTAFMSGDSVAITTYIVPVAYIVCAVMSVVMTVMFAIKLFSKKAPGRFNVFALIGLVAAIAAVVIMMITDGMEASIGAYVIAALFLLLLIIPVFVRKGAQVIDYNASKRLYGDNK